MVKIRKATCIAKRTRICRKGKHDIGMGPMTPAVLEILEIFKNKCVSEKLWFLTNAVKPICGNKTNARLNM